MFGSGRAAQAKAGGVPAMGWAARAPGQPWAGAGPGAVVVAGLWLLAIPRPWSGARAVVLVPPCLFLPSSQGFLTVIATQLLFSF